jgi:uncharacterized protein
MTRDDLPVASPTGPGGRIDSLDILRGFALLGMLIVHFHERTVETSGFDDLVRTLVWRLVESKSHGTFALLFGAGFAIQLRRATARGGPFVAMYLRRLAALAVFGFAAHALFGFNVLLGYAVWGVPLLLMRNWSTRALLATAVLSTVSVFAFGFAKDFYTQSTAGPAAVAAAADARRAAAVAVTSALQAAAAHGSSADLVRARLRHMAWFHTQPFFFMPNATLALFIAGLLLVRHRVFEGPRAHMRLLVVMAIGGLISWLTDNWLLPESVESVGLLRDQWLMFTYVSVALYLLANPLLTARLRIVGNGGRMALTNYLMQIAALDMIFSAYGMGVGTVRSTVGFTCALAAFAFQTALSTAWLARFRYGPAEWLWRSITYKQLQPMRRLAAERMTV